MAIGSEGEIGAVFTSWGKMSQRDRELWFQHMREDWNPNLHAGWAHLVHNTNNPYYNKDYKMENENKPEEEEPTETQKERLQKSIEFVVDMMNSGKVNPRDVYPKGRYQGD